MPFNVTVTVSLSSTPLVPTVTVPLALSSIAFSELPQSAVTEVILGTVVSSVTESEEADDTFPAASVDVTAMVKIASLNVATSATANVIVPPDSVPVIVVDPSVKVADVVVEASTTTA